MPHGVHTAAQIPPERRQAIVNHLAAGVSTDRTAALVHAAPNTVCLVRSQDAAQIAAISERIATNLDVSALSLSTRLVEEANLIPIQNVPIALAVILDKRQMLRGLAQSIVEHRSSVNHEDALRDAIDKLPSCNPEPPEPQSDPQDSKPQ